jgi:hypothetical protein
MDGVTAEYQNLQVVQRADADTLPEGLYEIESDRAPERLFDICNYYFVTGKTRLLLRIDAGSDIPFGLEAAYIREDGKRVMIAKIVDDPDAVHDSGHKPHAAMPMPIVPPPTVRPKPEPVYPVRHPLPSEHAEPVAAAKAAPIAGRYRESKYAVGSDPREYGSQV